MKTIIAKAVNREVESLELALEADADDFITPARVTVYMHSLAHEVAEAAYRLALEDVATEMRKLSHAQEKCGFDYHNDFGQGLAQGAKNIRVMLDELGIADLASPLPKEKE